MTLLYCGASQEEYFTTRITDLLPFFKNCSKGNNNPLYVLVLEKAQHFFVQMQCHHFADLFSHSDREFN